MSMSSVFSRRDPAETARIMADRRRYRRVQVDLVGRFMTSAREEFPCRVYDISVGGAALLTQSPSPVTEGERIVAYFDHLGRLEGKVARVFDGGFAMTLSNSLHKREKLAATLTWLINKSEMSGIEARRHDRQVPDNDMTELKLDEGVTVECKLLDVSISGASVATDARPEMGQIVQLGKLRAKVVRHHETGIAVEFTDVQNPQALKRHFS